MAIDNTLLTKAWITHLKRNQIAFSSKTEPGKLDYRKKVTSDILSSFLEREGDFSEEQISNAIHMVLAKKAQGSGQSKLQNNPASGDSVATKNEPPQQQAPKQIGSNQPKAQPVPPKKRYSKDNATDVEYRDINEELRDDTAYTLDEKDVEDVFSILTSSTPNVPDQETSPQQKAAGQKAAGQKQPTSPEEIQAKKEGEIRQLKRIIRDTMTPAQRKALWRILTDA
jgi:hypothetical protein